MASLTKKIRRQITNMPKYSVQDEVFENQAIARVRAFGKDRDVQMTQEDIDQSAADAVSDVQRVSSSTTDVVGAISAIHANTTGAKRQLSQDEAAMRGQKTAELYNTNQALAEEKDKAWMQNVYAPWDAKLRNLQQRKANRTAFWNNIAGGVITAAGAVLGGPVGAAIGSKIGGAVAGSGQATQADAMQGSMYGYNPMMPYS